MTKKRFAMPTLDLRRQGIPLFLAAAGWLALGATAVAALAPLRSFAVFAFVLTGPGAALVRLLPPRDFLEQAVLAVALSVSLAALVAEAAGASHVWRPDLMLAALAAICSGAAVAELTRKGSPSC